MFGDMTYYILTVLKSRVSRERLLHANAPMPYNGKC